MPFDPLNPPLPRPGDHLRWGTLPAGADAMVLAATAAGLHRTLLVVTADSGTAERLEAEIAFFAAEGGLAARTLRLPDWETLPYDRFSPHQDLVSERLRALARLTAGDPLVLLVPVATLMQRLAPVAFVAAGTLSLKPGMHLPPEPLRKLLVRAGYKAVENVYEHGEFAARGSVIDVFPMGLEEPVRIEYFDEDIETLRHFNPDTQRSTGALAELDLLPGREFPFHEEAIAAFRRRWHERFDNDHRACPDYQDIARGVAPGGVEYWMPLFFDACATLFDYLPEDTVVCMEERARAELDHAWDALRSRHASLGSDRTRPLLDPREICLPPDELRSALKNYTRIDFGPEPAPERAGAGDFGASPLGQLQFADKADAATRIASLLALRDTRVLFCAETPGRREMVAEMLRRAGGRATAVSGWQEFLASDVGVGLAVAPLDAGFVLQNPRLALVAESALFGRRVLQRRRRARESDGWTSGIRDLAELSAGVPVVHLEHGVGRYLGLQTLEVDGERAEFLCIEYAESAKLFVPVTSLDLVSRYTGVDTDNVQLARLGSDQWQKARRKAAEKIRDVAAELLEIHARRAARPGHAFEDPGAAYEAFAAAFPFEETPDQLSAIEAVLADMCAPRAMDRLICGDVGFGKTEVAMRAAFVAVHSGSQVAVLVPTTLLAEQHFETFSDRFADLPLSIASLSRFKSAQEQKDILARLAEGKIDIVIGTHGLLSSGVRYRNLGLVVVDEEHRFGVRQKDQLKALRASVDMLTLTATPIPRTLNMAMAGLRDISIISTPPARRLSVKTFVQRHDETVIRDALSRELRRGGQVFLLHNDVQSIEKRAASITALLPEARVAVAHGQMRERELERVMSDFYHKRFNVLCCTTIIETGIDIPSANTIVIERADKFGLAQLHQLRGRVGRSHHQAYAFLLTPDEKSMTGDAIKRLEAIAGTESLGAGFLLATHDLEIRGAGELLGDEQSGQIQAIGYSLYMDLLERAVKALRAGKLPDGDTELRPGLEVNLRIPALIPDDYLPDVHNRLVLYKRLSSAEGEDALLRLEGEMLDRFGPLPPPTRNLFSLARLRQLAATIGIARIEAGTASGLLEFARDTRVDPLTIVDLVQQDPRRFRLDGGGSRLRFTEPLPDGPARLAFVEELLVRLAARANTAPSRATRR